MTKEKEEKPRLTVQEQQDIRLRNNLIVMKRQELHILQNEYKLFMMELLNNKGLSPDKKYDIGQDGELTETKTK